MKKTALITGASRGIGKAISEALAKEGYNLILICHKNLSLLEESANTYASSYGTTSYCYEGDISDYSFLSSVCDDIKKKNIFVSLLVNNAGISYVGLLNDMSIEEWQKIINTNLSSMFYTAKLFTPDMIRKKEGYILNITSMWGQRGASCEVAYSASKGGVDAFTKALAKELAPSNIYVNAISCGVVDTDMMNVFSEVDKKELAEEIPIGRFCQPAEVATAVVNLLSNTYMTGQIIGLDGGYF
ncbi:MAG: SDR family NAD(P)-dependent oxidoreductase [Lachnospiraceae bacterium]|nr:SDR family NAD(P)-dependent oxidoreductase [Lachnospiraceae bacterium]